MTKKKNKCFYCDYICKGKNYHFRRHVKRKHPEVYEEFLEYYNKHIKINQTKKFYDFKCLNCGEEFKHHEKKRKFCSKSYSAIFNNKKRIYKKI